MLLDHPLFFTPNVATLVAFSQEKKRLILDKHLKGKDLLEEIERDFSQGSEACWKGGKNTSRARSRTEYFSTTPYKLGATAVKYQCQA